MRILATATTATLILMTVGCGSSDSDGSDDPAFGAPDTIENEAIDGTSELGSFGFNMIKLVVTPLVPLDELEIPDDRRIPPPPGVRRSAVSRNIQHSTRRNCNAAQPALPTHTPHLA